jgi:hypothetical protein
MQNFCRVIVVVAFLVVLPSVNCQDKAKPAEDGPMPVNINLVEIENFENI